MVSLVSMYYIGPGQLRIVYSSDASDPTFTIYREGVLIATTTQTEITLAVAPGTSPVIEILDDGSAPTPAYPAQIILTWLAVAGSANYQIAQYNGSSWTTLATITDDGSPTFSWTSNPQPDGQVATFKVTPIGSNGNAGTALTFAKLVVRFPDTPSVSITYSPGTGNTTIAAV